MLTTSIVNSARQPRAAPPALGDALALLKPVTWFPPMWAFLCGHVAAGAGAPLNPATVLVGALVAGPLVCGASQVLNDWCDRHVDALNEPGRPIPSGRVAPGWALALAVGWSALALAGSALLGPWGVAAAALGLLLGWAYSAPPFRFKRDGWLGNGVVGLSYESLAWITGAVVATGGALPDGRVLLLAVLYGAGAHGILTLNDFKAIAGDRVAGIRTLPARLGARRAALVACAVMLAAQLAATGLVLAWGGTTWALVTLPLLLAQLPMMRRFVAEPVARARWLSAFGVPLYVLGMLCSALGVRALPGGGA